ncbi:MAG TPA: M18 family aminopeptidase [Fibrobacteria bacterium]|nr:M18 family aminopeptidase [Fibrobacteria bacterium]
MLESFADDFFGFLSAAPSPWHASEALENRLRIAGFRTLEPGKPFPCDRGGKFLLRRGGALVGWVVPTQAPARLLLGLAHTDSPCLRLRPDAESIFHGCRKLSVEAYGGLLNHSWLDRELEVAGRVCFEESDGVREVLVRPRGLRPIVPSLAIHLDRAVNERGLVLDRERHLPAVCGLQDGRSFLSRLAESAGTEAEHVLSWDLCLGDGAPPALVGSGDLVASPRLDNLASCHALVAGLEALEPRSDTLVAVAFLDAEEVGSTSSVGADSVFLPQVLERIGLSMGLDRAAFLAWVSGGFALSADMAHAIHPNHPERHPPGHSPLLGQGPVLKWNAGLRYGTTAVGASRLRRLAREEGIPLQGFAMRADLGCGSTVGPLVSRQLALETVDCGAPMLAMHSARETMALSDQFLCTRLYQSFLRRA